MKTSTTTFAGFSQLAKELDSAPKLEAAQQAKVKEAGAIVAEALQQRELWGATFAELGVPAQLIPHATLECFLALYPGLRQADGKQSASAFASALANAKKIDPNGAAVAEFQRIMAREKVDPTGDRFPKDLWLVSVSGGRDYNGRSKNSIVMKGYESRPLELRISHDPATQGLSMSYTSGYSGSSSSSSWDWDGLSERSIQHLVDVVDAWLETDALKVAKGGQSDVNASFMRDHIKPLFEATLPSRKLAAERAKVTATLEGVLPPAAKVDSEAIKDALKETMPDGATVGRVEPSLLKRIVASIFG